jgi:hypothetical protein
MGTAPKENVQNFKAFYENLFSAEIVDGSAAAEKWCEEMESFPQDRGWAAPILPELKKAVAELKSTAPGLSGIGDAHGHGPYPITNGERTLLSAWLKQGRDWLML